MIERRLARRFLALNFIIALAFSLFEIIGGTLAAHSNVMLVDGAFMLVDALTYALNIWANVENEPAEITAKGTSRRDMIAAVVSVALLIITTTALLIDSIVTLVKDETPHKDELHTNEVVWSWVLWSGVINLLLDVAAWLVLIMSIGRRRGGDGREIVKSKHKHKRQGKSSVVSSMGVNVSSAVLHLARDTLTTFFVLETGVMLKLSKADGALASNEIDAVNTVIISAAVFCSTIYVAHDVWNETKSFFAK